MDRIATQTLGPTQRTGYRIVAARFAGGGAPCSSLPPTRAARSARSRGVFLAGTGERGLIRSALSLLCVALTAASLVAAAPRLLDAPAIVTSPALELVATSAQLPAQLCPAAD